MKASITNDALLNISGVAQRMMVAIRTRFRPKAVPGYRGRFFLSTTGSELSGPMLLQWVQGLWDQWRVEAGLQPKLFTFTRLRQASQTLLFENLGDDEKSIMGEFNRVMGHS